MREEVRSLQGKLSEVTNMAIQQGEKMREVRRAKREIDQENTTLRSTLTKTEVRNTGTREVIRRDGGRDKTFKKKSTAFTVVMPYCMYMV